MMCSNILFSHRVQYECSSAYRRPPREFAATAPQLALPLPTAYCRSLHWRKLSHSAMRKAGNLSLRMRMRRVDIQAFLSQIHNRGWSNFLHVTSRHRPSVQPASSSPCRVKCGSMHHCFLRFLSSNGGGWFTRFVSEAETHDDKGGRGRGQETKKHHKSCSLFVQRAPSLFSCKGQREINNLRRHNGFTKWDNLASAL